MQYKFRIIFLNLLFVLSLFVLLDHNLAQAAEKQDLEWIGLPGGRYIMGISVQTMEKELEKQKANPQLRAHIPREAPQHEVHVDPFEVLKTEVTVAQYRACVEAGACALPPKEPYCSYFQADPNNLPINCVNWSDADRYCHWAGAALPTEEEWEYAARSGGKDYKYTWGNGSEPSCEYAVMDEEGRGCGRRSLWPVCSKNKGNTEQGLCDMAGNAWEWVENEIYPYPDWDSTVIPHIDYPKDKIFFQGQKVIRGGGINSLNAFHVTLRGSHDREFKYGGLSFRCVRHGNMNKKEKKLVQGHGH